jgi:hypothetical protein
MYAHQNPISSQIHLSGKKKEGKHVRVEHRASGVNMDTAGKAKQHALYIGLSSLFSFPNPTRSSTSFFASFSLFCLQSSIIILLRPLSSHLQGLYSSSFVDHLHQIPLTLGWTLFDGANPKGQPGNS